MVPDPSAPQLQRIGLDCRVEGAIASEIFQRRDSGAGCKVEGPQDHRGPGGAEGLMGEDRRALGERCCVSLRGSQREFAGKERREPTGLKAAGTENEGRGGREERLPSEARRMGCSGQDRRANGGHRTEMASGSAFQYSTLATSGHPLSLSPPCSSLSLELLLSSSPPGPPLLLRRRCRRRRYPSLARPFCPSLARPRSRRQSPPGSASSSPFLRGLIPLAGAQHPPLDLESFYYALRILEFPLGRQRDGLSSSADNAADESISANFCLYLRARSITSRARRSEIGGCAFLSGRLTQSASTEWKCVPIILFPLFLFSISSLRNYPRHGSTRNTPSFPFPIHEKQLFTSARESTRQLPRVPPNLRIYFANSPPRFPQNIPGGVENKHVAEGPQRRCLGGQHRRLFSLSIRRRG